MTQPDPQQPNPYQGQPFPGYQPMPPAQPKKKKWPWILGGILVALFLLVGGCVALIAGAANEISDSIDSASSEAATPVDVKYRASGTAATVSITYTNASEDIAQETARPLPWETDIAVVGYFKYASLTVTDASGAPDASVTCEILSGDVVLYTNTGNGPYATASCSGEVGK